MSKRENEFRGNVRRNLIFYLPVKNRENDESIGELGDITEEGLLLLSQEIQSKNRQLDIAVELPKGEEYPPEDLLLTVQVQWSKVDPDNPELALTGCKIIEPGPKEQKLIRTLIRNIGFSNGQRQVTFNESIPDFTEEP